MKKIISSIILSLGATVGAYAQTEHRVSFNFGLGGHAYYQQRSNERVYQDLILPDPNIQGSYEYSYEKLKSAPLTFNLQYDCSLSKHIGVGLSFGYQRLKMYQQTNFIRSNGQQTSPFGNTYPLWENEHKNGELNRRIVYIMPEFTVYWFKKKHVAMYSEGAIGVRFDFESRLFYTGTPNSEKLPTEKNTKLCFQVSPVSVEVGGQRWRGFIELGYGIQGIAQFGVKRLIKGKDATKEIKSE